MTEQHEGLPVSGYRPQTSDAVSLVNQNKEMEERVLRQIEAIARTFEPQREGEGVRYGWLSVARQHVEQGFMALNRAVFNPTRVALPEDQQQGGNANV